MNFPQDLPMTPELTEYLRKEQKRHAIFYNPEPKVVVPKISTQHKLSYKNKEFMIGNCSICGDNVPIKITGRNPQGSLKYCCVKSLTETLEKRKAQSPEYFKVYYLKYNYNLTLDQFNTMFAQQNYVCKLCKEKPNKICVDHDHKCCGGAQSCGKCVRGLLCYSCNIGIGNLQDNPILIRAAADYVENFASKP